MKNEIYIYNTETGKKELFTPLSPGEVSFYCCGVTVYDLCHIGHARSAIAFDMIRKYFTHSGYRVNYVRNFTDVDDKIIARANETGAAWDEVAARFIDEYRVDMSRLNVSDADIEPRATDHIADIVEMVKTLIQKGFAYESAGDVFFRVRQFKPYGRLSKRNIEDLRSGARVSLNENKEDPLDFALWKLSKEHEPGWESPWGLGRPGWHIECSAMSVRHLGATFDIHGGGKDLVFPHHENEIAQSEACTGKQFVRYWVHNGFVTLNEEKMSKSLGNFFTIREIFEKFSKIIRGDSRFKEQITAESIRYLLLSTHYRHPIDFSMEGLVNSKSALDGFYDLMQRLNEMLAHSADIGQRKGAVINFDKLGAEIETAMSDDFNSAMAIGVLNRLRTDLNRSIEQLNLSDIKRFFEIIAKASSYLGIFTMPADDWSFGKMVTVGAGTVSLPAASETALPVQADAMLKWDNPPLFLPKPDIAQWSVGSVEEKENLLIRLRNGSRKNKNYKAADEIRVYLEERGRILEDRPDGTTRLKK